MKILTLNTWQERGPWEKRWEVIFEGIHEMQPDVIGFQEVFNEDWAREVQKRTSYQGLAFTIDHPGQMILTKEPMLEWKGVTLRSKSPTEDYLRHALYAETKIKGKPLAVFNTHLSWKLDESDVREKQVGDLLDFIDDHAAARESVVVGDFNAPPKTPEVRRMIVQGKYNDCFAALHPKKEGLTWDNKNPYAAGGTVMPDRRLDYVFTRNPSDLLAKLESVRLVYTEPNKDGIWASDHYGVLAEFA